MSIINPNHNPNKIKSPPKPEWLKKKYSASKVHQLKTKLRDKQLHTVCEEARCPNISECFSKGVATIMIMGDICTRSCKFCAVATGKPLALDENEPLNTAIWIKNQSLKHVVITSVDRDDLKDLGATHFAKTVTLAKEKNPNTVIEVLTPDFQGKKELILKVATSQPHIYNHNLETVERLTPKVRSAAKYYRSLDLIETVKKNFPNQITKSGIMLGLGETKEEVLKAMKDLVNHGCDMLTLGQYLQPTPMHLPIHSYIHPDEFEELKIKGETEIGFKAVFSGPFVRSSYLADEQFEAIQV